MFDCTGVVRGGMRSWAASFFVGMIDKGWGWAVLESTPTPISLATQGPLGVSLHLHPPPPPPRFRGVRSRRCLFGSLNVTLVRASKLRNRQLLAKQSPVVTVILHVNGYPSAPLSFPVSVKGGRDPDWAALASGPGTVRFPLAIVRRLAAGEWLPVVCVAVVAVVVVSSVYVRANESLS